MTDKFYRVEFEPPGKRGRCAADVSVLECAHRAGLGIASVCGGRGTCGTCRVRISGGRASPPTARERSHFSRQELNAGWRLACQAYPRGNLRVGIPAESMTTPQRIQLEGREGAFHVDPSVQQHVVKLKPPTLEDPAADAGRVLQELAEEHRVKCESMDAAVLRTLSPDIRSMGWTCRAVVRGREVMAVLPAKGRLLGLAVDLGTTKIAAYLLDLASGKTLEASGAMNPQLEYGEDVVSRITRAVKSPKEALTMQAGVANAIDGLAQEMTRKAGVEVKDIVEVVVVGNTAMHHLLLGLGVGQLARSPFVPTISGAIDVKAREIGMHFAPGAYVYLLPNIAGYVGADHVAALLATGLTRSQGISLLVDIGTNTEVSLVKEGRATSLSCASGPAFEGGNISAGMRAAAGAIERVRIGKNNRVGYETVDDRPAAGICGSGLLDAVAQMYERGIIDAGGRMAAGSPGVRKKGKQLEFVLAPGDKRGRHPKVTITQHDVRELQLAKGAIRAGIQVLLEACDCVEEQIGRVVIAGAFGTYIDVSSAIAVGMLPSLPLRCFHQVGNAAGMGAKMALLSKRERARAGRIASAVNYIELSGAAGFNRSFIEASYLGSYRMRNGERRETG